MYFSIFSQAHLEKIITTLVPKTRHGENSLENIYGTTKKNIWKFISIDKLFKNNNALWSDITVKVIVSRYSFHYSF